MWRGSLHAVAHERPAGGGDADDRHVEGPDASQGSARQETQARPAPQESDYHGCSPRSDDDVLRVGRGPSAGVDADARGALQRWSQPQPGSS